MATIRVTGATGFVGWHVVVALRAAGYRVRSESFGHPAPPKRDLLIARLDEM